MSKELSGVIEIPVLALRDVVVYPQMVIPLFVGREKSIRCLDLAMEQDKQVFLVDTNSSVVTGTLPGVTSTDDVGITYTVKDSGGNAGTNDIVIEPSGSQTIDGASAAKIQTNYGAMTVVSFSSSVNKP